MESFYTCSNPLDKQKSMLQKDGRSYTQRIVLLRKWLEKQKRSRLIYHQLRGDLAKELCSNELNPKLHTACAFLSPKSRKCLKSEAPFVFVVRTCQIFLAKLMFQLSLFDGALGTVAFIFEFVILLRNDTMRE